MASAIILQENATTPTPPSSGNITFYTKTDGNAYILNSMGMESAIGSTNAVTSLIGDVTGSGPGATTTTVQYVGGQSAANIAAAVVEVEAATSSNTPLTLIQRDSSGNFSANVVSATTFIGNLTGNASTATSAVTAIDFTGTLNGDVTGTQSATVVSMVDGYTASQVGASVLATEDATASNTATTIVLRDASGNFSANIITAALNGNANTSTNFTGSLSGDVTGTQSATSISSITVTAKLLTGLVTGPDTPIAATDTILAALEKLQAQISASSGSAITALTGDVDATGPGSATATIQPNAVSNSKLAEMLAFTIKGNNTGSPANPIDLTVAQLTAFTVGTPISQTPNNANAPGSAGTLAQSDHVHMIPTATPVQIGTTNVQGSAPSFAQSDHVHAITAPVVLGLNLTGYTTGTNTPINSSDTLLQGFENLQAQISATVGDAITSLTGDVTASGPGAAASNIEAIQGNTVSGTTGTGNVVFADAPTFSGNVNMGGFLINNLENPVSMQDAATKMYVDFLAQGIYPQNPIIISNLINDSLSTPPGSPVNFTTTYLIGSSPTGAWSSIGAGHFVYYDGSIWHDALGRAVQVGDRVGINISNTGTLGGNMVGEQNNIATVTNATPGSYAYTFAVPANRWLVLDNNPLSYDAGDTYYFNGTNWIEIATGFVTNPGIGLSVSGVTWNVNSDNSTIGINGSNQLYVLSDGITANQIANNTVTYGKLQNETASTLLGNPTGSSINPSEITLGSTLAFVGSILETDAMTGDVTSSANSFATTLSKIQGTAITGTTGTGNVVLSVSPTITGTLTATLMGNVTGNLTGNVTGNVSGSAASFTGSLLGDITGTQGATTVSKIQGTTVSGTTGSGNVAFSASPTFTGTISAVAASLSGQLASTFSSTTAVVFNTTSFIFDTVNNSFGIGTQPSTSVMIDGVNSSGASKLVQMTGYGIGSTTGYRGRFARGTSGAPTATQTGDILSAISGRGYGASQFAAASTGVMNIVAAENFTNTSNATYLQFSVTPTGSVTSAEAMRIASTGVTIGPQSASTAIHNVNGGLHYTNKTITSSYTCDTATTDFQLFVNQSAALTITLPAPTQGRVIKIKDVSGLAQTYGITIAPYTSEKIENLSTSKVLYTNFGAWEFQSDGTNWWMT